MSDETCRQKLEWTPAEGGQWRRTARCERDTGHAGPHTGQGYTWGKFGTPPTGDDTAARPVQLCPKCKGQGVVSRPPWVPADIQSWTSTQPLHRCNLCDGQMVIPA